MSRNAAPHKPCRDRWTKQEPTRDAFSHTRHAEVDTNDASRAQSTVHNSSTNPSTTHRSFACAVSHVCRVDQHLSVLTHSILTSTSCMTLFKQLRAQAVLDDNTVCETPLVRSLFHPAERKDAVLEQGERFQHRQVRRRRGRCVRPREGLEGQRGKCRWRKHSKAQSFLRGHVGHISHSDNEADLRATSSTRSSTLHDGETWKRPWITSVSKHSGVRKQPSRGIFSTSPKATPRR